MNWPGIERQSSEPLANTLLIRPMARLYIYIYSVFFRLILFGFMIYQPLLMSNPVLTCPLNIWSVNTFCRYKQLNDQTVLFLTIQFDPFRCFTIRARVDLGAMAIKGDSAFPKAPALLEPHHQIDSCYKQYVYGGVLPLCRNAVVVFYSPSRLGSDFFI